MMCRFVKMLESGRMFEGFRENVSENLAKYRDFKQNGSEIVVDSV